MGAEGPRPFPRRGGPPDLERLHAPYAEREVRRFFEPLVEFMSSGPVTAVVIEGEQCIAGFRALAGATDPTAALPGTIGGCLLYTSDAAGERSSVDLGGRRNIKKKTKHHTASMNTQQTNTQEKRNQ